MDLVSIYLRELRKPRGFTQESLAVALGVSKSTIERFDYHKGDIAASTYEDMIRVLRASRDHVNELYASTTATAEYAVGLARQWLRDEVAEAVTQTVVEVRAEGKVDEALALIKELEEDPEALARFLGYGQSLVENRRRPR